MDSRGPWQQHSAEPGRAQWLHCWLHQPLLRAVVLICISLATRDTAQACRLVVRQLKKCLAEAFVHLGGTPSAMLPVPQGHAAKAPGSPCTASQGHRCPRSPRVGVPRPCLCSGMPGSGGRDWRTPLGAVSGVPALSTPALLAQRAEGPLHRPGPADPMSTLFCSFQAQLTPCPHCPVCSLT